MIVIGYSTWGKDEANPQPIVFNDDNSPHIKRKPMLEVLGSLASAFNKPSDCVWIVPGTQDY